MHESRRCSGGKSVGSQGRTMHGAGDVSTKRRILKCIERRQYCSQRTRGWPDCSPLSQSVSQSAGQWVCWPLAVSVGRSVGRSVPQEPGAAGVAGVASQSLNGCGGWSFESLAYRHVFYILVPFPPSLSLCLSFHLSLYSIICLSIPTPLIRVFFVTTFR